MKAAGLNTNTKEQRKLTDDYLFDKAKALAEELGRIPKSTEFPHAKTVLNYFGGYRIFLKKAGLVFDVKHKPPRKTL